MTDKELLDAIERGLSAGSDDYLHIYWNAGGFIVERDGEWLNEPTLREALIALYTTTPPAV